MGQGYAVAGIEPPLEELLDDLIMRRDGIEPADVWRSIAAARARLGPEPAIPTRYHTASILWPSSRPP
jgi:hypothetical protein